MPQTTSNDWEVLPSHQEDWQPITTPEPAKQNTITKLWHAISDPLWTKPTELANTKANEMTDPNQHPSMWTGFKAGALQGLGNLVSGLSSPLNLATAGMGGLEYGAGKAGLESLGTLANIGTRVASAPIALHGASNILSPDSSISDRLMGGLELAGGTAGALHSPSLGSIGESLSSELPPINDLPLNEPINQPVNQPIVNPDKLQGRITAIGNNIANKGSSSEATNKILEDLKTQLTQSQSNKPLLEKYGTVVHIDENDIPKLKLAGENGYVLDENNPFAPDGKYRMIKSKSSNNISSQGLDTLSEPLGAVQTGSVQQPPIDASLAPEQSISNPGANNVISGPVTGVTQTGPGGLEPPNNIPDNSSGTIPPQRVPQALNAINQQASLAKPSQKPGLYSQLSANIRAILTSYDLSAPGRQGMGLITHPEYWSAFKDMFRAWGSETASKAIQDSIINKPSGLFQPNIQLANGKMVSYADRVGLNLNRDQFHTNGTLAEKYLPGVSNSERAYAAFLNKAGSDIFDKFISQAERDGLNPVVNLQVGKDIADSINTSIGRTSLGNIEKSATAMKILNETFFAPKLAASRIKMYTRVLDPRTYMNENPMIRKEALRSLLSIVGTTFSMGQLAKFAGGEVNFDPTNSDFGKIKLGNTRIDPMAGLQQFGVAAARLISGQSTSSTSGNVNDLTNPKFGGQTRESVMQNLITSKLAPIPSMIYAWMNTKEFDGTPFDVKQALVNRTVPMAMQDLADIYKDNPSLIPVALVPIIMGWNSQTYGR